MDHSNAKGGPSIWKRWKNPNASNFATSILFLQGHFHFCGIFPILQRHFHFCDVNLIFFDVASFFATLLLFFNADCIFTVSLIFLKRQFHCCNIASIFGISIPFFQRPFYLCYVIGVSIPLLQHRFHFCKVASNFATLFLIMWHKFNFCNVNSIFATPIPFLQHIEYPDYSRSFKRYLPTYKVADRHYCQKGTLAIGLRVPSEECQNSEGCDLRPKALRDNADNLLTPAKYKPWVSQRMLNYFPVFFRPASTLWAKFCANFWIRIPKMQVFCRE